MLTATQAAGAAPRGDAIAPLLAVAAHAGISLADLSRSLAVVPEASLPAALEYLRQVAESGDSPGALRFHMALLAGPGADPSSLTELRRELRGCAAFSPEVARFVERTGLVARMEALLFDRPRGPAGQSGSAPRESGFAFLRSAFAFGESAERLFREDPNLIVLFDAISRHGSVDRYYAEDELPRRAIGRLVERGFDAGHYVFGRGQIAAVGVGALRTPEQWPSRVRQIVRRVVGSRDGAGLAALSIHPRKLYHRLRPDYERLRDSGSIAAGTAMLDALLPLVRDADERLLRRGLHVERARVAHALQEIEYLRAAAGRRLDGRQPGNLRAIRSPKLVPDILFDNTRFGCCLFKPAGLFHGEITRLVLDPLTPMIELWSEPYQEFLGLVTLYPGVNGNGERTVMVDTFEYDDRLLDFKGYNPTMRFVLDAVMIDAALGGAEKVAVFAAPYGKPIGFANFVRHEIPRRPSIRYCPGYYFASVDLTDTALQSLRVGRHHYTVALGYDRPMRGVIDYGYNYVGEGRVEKWLDSGRGVLEIDVAAYLKERPAPAPPRRLSTAGVPAELLVHAPPDGHAIELARREAWVLDAFARESAAMSITMVKGAACVDLAAALCALDHAAFPPELRYDYATYLERCAQPNARVLAASHQGRLAGFALVYPSPTTEPTDLFLDVLAVVPEEQAHGLGAALLRAVLGLATVSGFRQVLTLVREAEPGRLDRFYRGMSFEPIGPFGGVGVLYRAPLGLAGRWARPWLKRSTRRFESALAGRLAHPVVAIVTEADEHVIANMLALERAFPAQLRYASGDFHRRLRQWDAYALQVWDGRQPVAFAIASSDPVLPDHAFFLDSMCVSPAYQGLGIGSALHQLNLRLPAFAGYTSAVFYCEPRNSAGVDLPALYGALGARMLSADREKVTMTALLRLDRALEALAGPR